MAKVLGESTQFPAPFWAWDIAWAGGSRTLPVGLLQALITLVIDQWRKVFVDWWVGELAKEEPATTSLTSGGGVRLPSLVLCSLCQ